LNTMPTGGNPTGIVFNGSDGFVVMKSGVSGPARFLFATEQGVIAAWSPGVDLTHAIRVVNRAADGTSYKGLALSGDGLTQLLYATDFFHAKIDVYDSQFHKLALPAGRFVDVGLPRGEQCEPEDGPHTRFGGRCMHRELLLERKPARRIQSMPEALQSGSTHQGARLGRRSARRP